MSGGGGEEDGVRITAVEDDGKVRIYFLVQSG